MELAALVILVIFSMLGFAAIFFTNFGTVIILIGSILYAILTNFSVISIKTLLILLTLYLAGEISEYVFIIAGARKFGSSNKAAIGALIGGILGAIIGAGFFGIGLLLGTFLGVFLGAFLVELFIRKDLLSSLKAGAGAVSGRIASIVAKVIIAIIMFGIMAIRIGRS